MSNEKHIASQKLQVSLVDNEGVIKVHITHLSIHVHITRASLLECMLVVVQTIYTATVYSHFHV